MSMGDYSTNVAMAYAKQLGKKPLELATEIKNKLEEKKTPHISKIDVVNPGFINFFFTPGYFSERMEKLRSGDLRNHIFYGQKFFLEHTQPNPFKVFHIGHLMNNTIGESIARILIKNGAEIKTCSYHGDVGLHVAKAIWGLLVFVGQVDARLKEKWDKNVSPIKILETSEIINKEKLEDNLMFAYEYGSKHYELDEDARKEIQDINKKIYDRSDKKVNELYDWGRTRSLDNFEAIYERLGSSFDYHFYESESGEVGKSLVLENIGKVFEEGDEGAVIFRGENFIPKTHTRVFLTKESLPTYEAKELGLAKMKNDLWSYNQSITVTAAEQDSFFNVVEVAIGEVFPELKGKLKHLSHGMLKLPSGKMSSRLGNIISADSLIDQVKQKIKEKINDDVNAEIIAVGAIKYSILRQAIGGDIIFDFDKSISFEGDSGPYLQYATVRANSILNKAIGIVDVSNKIPNGWNTTNLEKMLDNFLYVLERAGREYAPHHIVTYLTELSGEFNSFYASHKIIDASDSTSSYRLSLTRTYVYWMVGGLHLLGIKVPSQM